MSNERQRVVASVNDQPIGSVRGSAAFQAGGLGPPQSEEFETERRASERTNAVYRPVLLELEEFARFCLVKNLSSGGMMGRAFAEFAVGLPLTVQFHPDHIIPGTISWSQEGSIGIQFDREIDVPEVLKKLAERHDGDKINRAPRLQIDCHAVLETNSGTMPIMLQDISQRGIKAKASGIRPGDEVNLRIPGMDSRKAVVRWIQGGLAGMNFFRPIAFDELAMWVIDTQLRSSRSSAHD